MKNAKTIHSKLLIAAAISMLLVACKSTPMKDDTAVEDKSAGMSTSDGSDVKGAVIDGSGADGSMNELNDPNNILSKRNIYFDYNSDEYALSSVQTSKRMLNICKHIAMQK